MGGGGSTYDYGFRIYNPSIAKFLSVDPLADNYPWYTPYQFAGNKPVWKIDLDGLEEAPSDAEEYDKDQTPISNPNGSGAAKPGNVLLPTGEGFLEEFPIDNSVDPTNEIQVAGLMGTLFPSSNNSGNVVYNNGYRTPDGKFASPNGNLPLAGETAESAVWDAIEAKEGWRVTRGRVYVKDANGVVRVYDGVAHSPGGENIGLEIKSGSAKRTASQLKFDRALNASKDVSVKGTGQNAGLKVSRCTEIRVEAGAAVEATAGSGNYFLRRVGNVTKAVGTMAVESAVIWALEHHFEVVSSDAFKVWYEDNAHLDPHGLMPGPTPDVVKNIGEKISNASHQNLPSGLGGF